MEFKAFPSIKKLDYAAFVVTQKIHGSNAQVYIYPDESGELRLLTGSRTRWITPDNDNYGFATFVYANKQEFIDKLGIGQHFGEWAGPGINSGEGLKEKTFVLFDFWKYDKDSLPPQTVLVPVLYSGKLDLSITESIMEDLKTNGSKLVPGFMRPEGIVISINQVRYKKVFDEETQWKRPDKVKAPKIIGQSFDHLLQPIRLEKLLSRDEQYIVRYPESLKDIVFTYLDDLVKEEQITGTEEEISQIKKAASRPIFTFVKSTVDSLVR